MGYANQERFKEIIRTHMLSLDSDKDPWQVKGNCGKKGVLDSYDRNPFDSPYELEDEELQRMAMAESIKAAKEFCPSCPVFDKCTEWAQKTRYVGVAAGKLWNGKGRNLGRYLLDKNVKESDQNG